MTNLAVRLLLLLHESCFNSVINLSLNTSLHLSERIPGQIKTIQFIVCSIEDNKFCCQFFRGSLTKGCSKHAFSSFYCFILFTHLVISGIWIISDFMSIGKPIKVLLTFLHSTLRTAISSFASSFSFHRTEKSDFKVAIWLPASHKSASFA